MSTDPLYGSGMDDLDVQTLRTMTDLVQRGIYRAEAKEMIATGHITYAAGCGLEPYDIEIIGNALGKQGIEKIRFEKV